MADANGRRTRHHREGTPEESEESYVLGDHSKAKVQTKPPKSRPRRRDQPEQHTILDQDVLRSHAREASKATAEENVKRIIPHQGDTYESHMVNQRRLEEMEQKIKELQVRFLSLSQKAIAKTQPGDTIESFPSFPIRISVIRGEDDYDGGRRMAYMIQLDGEDTRADPEDDDDPSDLFRIVHASVKGFPEEARGWIKHNDAKRGVYIVGESSLCPEWRLYLTLFENKLPFYNDKTEEETVSVEHETENVLAQTRESSVVFVHISHSANVPDWGMRARAMLLANIARGNPHLFLIESSEFDSSVFDDEVRKINSFGPLGEYTDRERMVETNTIVSMFMGLYEKACIDGHVTWARDRRLINKVNSPASNASAFISANGSRLLAAPVVGAFRRIDILDWFAKVYKQHPPKTDTAYGLYMVYLASFVKYTMNGCVSSTIIDSLSSDKEWTNRIIGESLVFTQLASLSNIQENYDTYLCPIMSLCSVFSL